MATDEVIKIISGAILKRNPATGWTNDDYHDAVAVVNELEAQGYKIVKFHPPSVRPPFVIEDPAALTTTEGR